MVLNVLNFVMLSTWHCSICRGTIVSSRSASTIPCVIAYKRHSRYMARRPSAKIQGINSHGSGLIWKRVELQKDTTRMQIEFRSCSVLRRWVITDSSFRSSNKVVERDCLNKSKVNIRLSCPMVEHSRGIQFLLFVPLSRQWTNPKVQDLCKAGALQGFQFAFHLLLVTKSF